MVELECLHNTCLRERAPLFHSVMQNSAETSGDAPPPLLRFALRHSRCD